MIYQCMFIFLLLICLHHTPAHSTNDVAEKDDFLPTSFITSLHQNSFDLEKKYPKMNFKTLPPFCDLWQEEKDARKTNTYFFYSSTENSIVTAYKLYARFLKKVTNRTITPLRNLLNAEDYAIDMPSFQKRYDYNKLHSCFEYFDHIPYIRYQLLSAQYSLFERQTLGEDTLDYYDGNISILGCSSSRYLAKKQVYQIILPQMLEPLGLTTERAQQYVAQLDKLFAKRDWKKGGMIHIGISKNYLPQLAYLSGIGGCPLMRPEDTSLATFLDLYRKGWKKRTEKEEEQYRNILKLTCSKSYLDIGGQVRLLVTSPYFNDPEITKVSFHFDPEDRIRIETFLENHIWPMIDEDSTRLRENFDLRHLILRQGELSAL